MQKGLLMHGEPQVGKTVIAHMLAAYFSGLSGKSKYLLSKGFDALGLFCRDGAIGEIGAVIYDDVLAITCKDKPLTVDEWKSVFDIRGAGTYASRYAETRLPAGMQRIVTQDYCEGGRTWAASNDLPALDAVLRNDQEAYNSCSAAQRAVAERCIAFDCVKPMLNDAYLAEMKARQVHQADTEHRDHPDVVGHRVGGGDLRIGGRELKVPPPFEFQQCLYRRIGGSEDSF